MGIHNREISADLASALVIQRSHAEATACPDAGNQRPTQIPTMHADERAVLGRGDADVES